MRCKVLTQQSYHAGPQALQVLKYALSLLPKESSKLRLVRVVIPDDPELADIGLGDDVPWTIGSGTPESKLAEETARDACLVQLRQLLIDAGGLPASTAVELLVPVVKGSVAETIIAELTPPPGLCIVGSRGLGAVKRFVTGMLDRLIFAGVGSVSDALLRSATFPVAVIPAAPQRAQETAEATAGTSKPVPATEAEAPTAPETPVAKAGRSLQDLAIDSAAL